MTNLLHISVSTRGEGSFSRKIGTQLIDAMKKREPEFAIVRRDLAATPPPHPDQEFVTANLMRDAERGPAERQVLTHSELLIAELEAADTVVIDTPMHNFTVPSALKAWIDYVVRKDRTFRSTPNGKVGLLKDRPVYVVIACGGAFPPDPSGQTDFLTPYLKYLFSTIGIVSVEILRLEKIGRSDEAREAALNMARAWIANSTSAPA
jgi:FMN-dependent NADH-azoreductase